MLRHFQRFLSTAVKESKRPTSTYKLHETEYKRVAKRLLLKCPQLTVSQFEMMFHPEYSTGNATMSMESVKNVLQCLKEYDGLSHHSFWNLAMTFIERSRERGDSLPLEPPTLEKCLVMVAQALSRRGWEGDISRFTTLVLNKWQHVVTEDLLCYMILGLGKVNRFDKIDEILVWMQRHCQPMTMRLYSALMSGFCVQGHVDHVIEMIDTMQSNGMKLNTEIANLALKHFVKNNHKDGCLVICNRMKRLDVPWDDVTYDLMIDLRCKNDSISEALDLLQEMKISKVKRSIYSYYPIIEKYFAQEKVVEAMQLVDEMKIDRLFLDPSGFHIVIVGLLKNKLLSKATQVYYLSKRFYVRLPTATVELYALALGEKKDYSMLLTLIKHMKKENRTFSEALRCKFIVALGKCECPEKMFSLFNEIAEPLEAQGSLVSLGLINAMIVGLKECKKFDEAVAIAEKHLIIGLEKAPRNILEALFECYSVQQNVLKMEEIYKSIRESGNDIGVSVYASLIRGWVNIGDLDRVNELYQELVDRGMDMNSSIVNSIILMNAKEGKDGIKKAMHAYEYAKSSGTIEKSTFEYLVPAVAHHVGFESGLELMRAAETYSIPIAGKILESVLISAISCGNFEFPIGMWKRIIDPNDRIPFSYSSAVICWISANQIADNEILLKSFDAVFSQCDVNEAKRMFTRLGKLGYSDLIVPLLYNIPCGTDPQVIDHCCSIALKYNKPYLKDKILESIKR